MIVLVVFGHAWRGLATSDLVPADLFASIDSRIYAFHMPVFFILSGWFFLPSLKKTALPAFYRGRVLRLFWPMVLWTYLFLFMKVLAGSFSNAPIEMKDLLVLPVPGILHMWFLWVLLLLSFAFSLLKLCCQSPEATKRGLWIAVAVVAGLQMVDLSPRTAHWIGTTITNAPFFLVGIILGYTGVLQRLPQTPFVAVGIFLAVLVSWPVLTELGLSLPGSMILSLCVLIICSTLKAGSVIYKAGLWLGAASMAIYLAHTIFSAALREGLLVMNIQALWIHLLLSILVGLTGPIILLKLAQKTKTKPLLGF